MLHDIYLEMIVLNDMKFGILDPGTPTHAMNDIIVSLP